VFDIGPETELFTLVSDINCMISTTLYLILIVSLDKSRQTMNAKPFSSIDVKHSLAEVLHVRLLPFRCIVRLG
jgi:hypothetical protein